ncbi:MAG: hypothetical protein Q27BPR15_15315 [Rhodobacter sp. CACIA14H1]|nr:MAG: hypothetical protein Q27BPR15_15315 [Rhodobacter sp. CACIA14H1]
MMMPAGVSSAGLAGNCASRGRRRREPRGRHPRTTRRAVPAQSARKPQEDGFLLRLARPRARIDQPKRRRSQVSALARSQKAFEARKKSVSIPGGEGVRRGLGEGDGVRLWGGEIAYRAVGTSG